MWKVLIPIAVLGGVITLVFVLLSFNQMAMQISVRPWEDPMLLPPEGSVAVNANDDYTLSREESSTRLENPFKGDMQSVVRGAKAYKSYCLACHGDSLDGFGPVMPSLPQPNGIKSLAGKEISQVPDGELFWINRHRVGAHPPIGTSMSYQENWDVISYIRSKAKREQ